MDLEKQWWTFQFFDNHINKFDFDYLRLNFWYNAGFET